MSTCDPSTSKRTSLCRHSKTYVCQLSIPAVIKASCAPLSFCSHRAAGVVFPVSRDQPIVSTEGTIAVTALKRMECTTCAFQPQPGTPGTSAMFDGGDA